MYRPWCAFTRTWSRAAFAACSLAKPPTRLGLLMPVSGSLTRITYDQVCPRFMTPSRSLGTFLRGSVLRAGSSEGHGGDGAGHYAAVLVRVDLHGHGQPA